MTVLKTERLSLSELTGEEAGFVFRLMNSKGWLQYIGDRGIRTIEDARQYILNNTMKSYTEHGYGMYLVRTEQDQVPIGMCGLVRRNFLEYTDIGFAFLPEYNGKGYAFESASAVLQYARESLGMKKIIAIVNHDNQPSIRLIEKLGMQFEKTVPFPGEDTQIFQFSTAD
ncbi:GNAT family N-acetyltransferase [Flavihumibacter stibioxidans]|uniref:N-acetyltransferase domain-containing protein n=1 Tax=Flavihumibacter stibioxidans TaxID=1834163 RepID=A0ABR7M3X3_9BACT|nr:GNAT family N-acetyltransferase [Flavihumibacter stibioxidans]MBC6489717.1 hypothetical protein [Flavihumibacter stibioxidans]